MTIESGSWGRAARGYVTLTGVVHLVVAGALAGQGPGAPYAEASAVPIQFRAAATEARRLVHAFMAERGIPGTSVAVGVDGRIVWSEGFGYSDVELGVPVTPLTKFRGGSTSKPMTQAAASLLKEEGRMDFDVPVQRYVPSFPEKGHVITPRHLMAHTSGIRHYPPEGNEFHSATHYEDIVEALEIFENDPLLFEPGTAESYSTYGANLLGAAVQGAAGEDFLAVLHEYVFAPLGMLSTVGDHTDRIILHRTGFYERTNRRPHYHLRQSSWGDGTGLGELLNAPYVDNSNKWAGGGLLTTPEDLVRFGSAHLRPGFLTAESLTEILTPGRTENGEVQNRGLNWSIETDDEGRRVISHGGGGVGSNSSLRVYLEEGVVVAIQANLSQSNPGVLSEPIAELFISALD